MKKSVISLLLCIIMLISVAAPAAAAAIPPEENLPVVFIGGKGTTLIDSDHKVIYPFSYPDDYILNAVKSIMPTLAKAIVTNDYTKYCDEFYDSVSTIYKDMPLNGDGVPDNGTDTDFRWNQTKLSWSVRDDELYRIFDYVFYYDWRTDPCSIADDFAKYIDDVLAVTGAPKVRIIGRCMGGNIVMAYLTEYGCEKVDSCLYYCTTVNGTSFAGAAFSGQFNLGSNAIDRFATDYLGDDELATVIKSAVTLCNKTYGLELPKAAINGIYEKISSELVYRLLLATYATFPSYWSMIDDTYYEAAKENVFGGRETEYAGLIEKIDNYHYNVQAKVDETLTRLQQEGMKLSIVCKYGRQMVPISAECDELNDDAVELYSASFGATCSKVDSTLSNEYISAVEARGLSRYVAPDRQVDVSTAYTPDYTWVIKNNAHSDFASCIDDLMMTILRYDGHMSIYDDARYPQFLVYNKEENTITPMDENNCNTYTRWQHTFFSAVRDFFKALFAFIKSRLITK